MDSGQSCTEYIIPYSTSCIARVPHTGPPFHPESIIKTLDINRPGHVNPPASQESDSGNRSCDSSLELKSRAGSTGILQSSSTWGYHTRTRMHATIGDPWVFRTDMWSALAFDKSGQWNSRISFYVLVISTIYLQSTSSRFANGISAFPLSSSGIPQSKPVPATAITPFLVTIPSAPLHDRPFVPNITNLNLSNFPSLVATLV